MSKLRVSLIIEYEVDPVDYNVETIEQAAEEEKAALDNDLIGTLAWLEGDTTIKVEVV